VVEISISGRRLCPLVLIPECVLDLIPHWKVVQGKEQQHLPDNVWPEVLRSSASLHERSDRTARRSVEYQEEPVFLFAFRFCTMTPVMRTDFKQKSEARTAVWDVLENEDVARFPFPPHGRIPNFEGARRAAERLFQAPLLAGAQRIKVNPDAPQWHVRIEALRRGVTVYVPSPRLRGGFKRLVPDTIPADEVASAASLSNMDQWAEAVGLDALSSLDAIVTGSVAVTRDGRRCGKGEGYSDLEYAILRELGHAPAPVATTVHPLQIVGSFPTDRHDVLLSLVVTPDDLVSVDDPPAPPDGVDWETLSDEDLDAMPILQELQQRNEASSRKSAHSARTSSLLTGEPLDRVGTAEFCGERAPMKDEQGGRHAIHVERSSDAGRSENPSLYAARVPRRLAGDWESSRSGRPGAPIR